jgi:hypothetical protein
VFHSLKNTFDRTSFAGTGPKFTFAAGLLRQYSHRITSALIAGYDARIAFTGLRVSLSITSISVNASAAVGFFGCSFGFSRCTSVKPSSAAATNSIELPSLLCISWPSWSRTRPWPSSVLNGGLPSLIIVLSASSA